MCNKRANAVAAVLNTWKALPGAGFQPVVEGLSDAYCDDDRTCVAAQASAQCMDALRRRARKSQLGRSWN